MGWSCPRPGKGRRLPASAAAAGREPSQGGKQGTTGSPSPGHPRYSPGNRHHPGGHQCRVGRAWECGCSRPGRVGSASPGRGARGGPRWWGGDGLGQRGQGWRSGAVWISARHGEGSGGVAPAPGELPAARRDPFPPLPWQNKQLSLITRCLGNCWTSEWFSGVRMCFCWGAASSPCTLARAQSPPRAQVTGRPCLLDGVPMPPCPHCRPAGTVLIPAPRGQATGVSRDRVPHPWVLPSVDTGAGELCPVGWTGTGVPLPGCAVPCGSPPFPEGGRGALGCAGAGAVAPMEATGGHARGGRPAGDSLCGDGQSLSSSAARTATGSGAALGPSCPPDRRPPDRRPPDRHPQAGHPAVPGQPVLPAARGEAWVRGDPGGPLCGGQSAVPPGPSPLLAGRGRALRGSSQHRAPHGAAEPRERVPPGGTGRCRAGTGRLLFRAARPGQRHGPGHPAPPPRWAPRVAPPRPAPGPERAWGQPRAGAGGGGAGAEPRR